MPIGWHLAHLVAFVTSNILNSGQSKPAHADIGEYMALTPGTLIDGARMYAAASDAVNDVYPNSLHVLSHLLGMAIELALKAFLVSHGRTEQELRKFGHDLRSLLEEAEAAGLTSTGSRRFRLGVLGANYQDRIFAYPEEANLTVILPASLRGIAQELISEVFGSIKGEELLKKFQAEPGLSVQSTYPADLDASSWAVQSRGSGVKPRRQAVGSERSKRRKR